LKNQNEEKNWKKIIEERKQSGLTVREWCKQHSINENIYYYHQTKIRKSESADIVKDTDDWIEINSLKAEINSEKTDSIIIRIKDFEVEITENSNQAILPSILKVLKTVC